METFRSLRMVESKESIIKKMPNLTDEQKDEVIQFFNKYSAFEKEVDWNKWKTLTWEDLSKVIYKDRGTKSQVRKKIKAGLEGFIEGKDYDILAEGEWEGEPYVAYIPYTWEASRMIASPSVPPVKLKYNLKLRKTEPIAAKWCTAHNTEDSYWYRHTTGPDFSAFIYLCGETIPTKKVAIELNGEGKETNCDGMGFRHFVLKKEDGKILHTDTDYINYSYWDFNDNYDTFKSNQIPDMKPYFLRALEEMEKRREDLLKNRYEKELDETLKYYTDGDFPDMPDKETIKKAVMNNFRPEVWVRASMVAAYKGEIDEDFVIKLSSLRASSFILAGIFDKQKVLSYRREVGLEDAYLAEMLTNLYEDEGPDAIKPFFSEGGLQKAEEYVKEHFKSLDGVIFLMNQTLNSNLIA